jgi:hypothetical protein
VQPGDDDDDVCVLCSVARPNGSRGDSARRASKQKRSASRCYCTDMLCMFELAHGCVCGSGRARWRR